ncbi:MAG: ankyrin repeat domain-containing protein [bacterium]|nr:ankyrin repeat domain-containing protein [bacterium]
MITQASHSTHSPAPAFRRVLPALLASALLALLSPQPAVADSGADLTAAICEGDLAAVKRIVARGQGVNQKMGKDGNYPLELASYCYGGKPAIASYLLRRGADVNRHDGDYTTLMWAIRSMDSVSDSDPMRKVVFQMMAKRPKLRYQDPTTGRTPLMLAASAGDTKLVKMMLARKADRKPRTKGDWCVSGNYKIQCSAADHARLGGHVELALSLDGKSPTNYRKTLHYAAKTGDLGRVQALLKQNADPNARETISKFTPLYYATMGDHKNIVRALIQAGAKPDPVDFSGTTPLRQAVVYYKRDMAKLLIDLGAKANNHQTQGCGGGLSEFGWAIEYSQHDLAKYMIEKGALDPRNPGTAFQATYGRSAEDITVARLFLKKGARPTTDDILRLKKVSAANDWIRKAGHNQKIVAMLEKALNEPAPEPEPLDPGDPDNSDDQMAVDEPPEIPEELLIIRMRSFSGPIVQTRSLNSRDAKAKQAARAKLPAAARGFDQKFRDARGKLDANPLR